MESNMFGVTAAVDTSVLTGSVLTGAALACAATTGTAYVPRGIAAVLLPGTGVNVPARLHAAADASKPLPKWAQARMGRQDTPQQLNLRKFAYKNRIAATSGAAAGPHPAWDPV